MNIFIPYESALRRRPNFGASIALGLSIGALSAALLVATSDFNLRPWNTSAVANDESPQSGVTRQPDSRIAWTSLPTGLTSNVAADGEGAWVAVVDRIDAEGAFQSHLLAISKNGASTLMAEFQGRPTVLRSTTDFVLVAAGAEVLVFDKAGKLLQAIAAPGASAANPVISIDASAEAVYFGVDGLPSVFEVGSADGQLRRTFAIAPLASATTIFLGSDGATLFASTPFGTTRGHEPGSILLDLKSGEVATLNVGRPFSISKNSDGSLLTTQAVPGGGLRGINFVAAGAETSVRESLIPWNGRWDQAAMAGDNIWGAVAGSGKLFHERAGTLEEYQLPVNAFVPSLPSGTTLSPAKQAELASTPTEVTSIAVLSDGTVVAVTNGLGARLAVVTPS